MLLSPLDSLSLRDVVSYVGGGSGIAVGVKVLWDYISKYWDRRIRTQFDLNDSLTQRVQDLTSRLTNVEQEVDSWKSRYYDLKELNSQLQHNNDLLRYRNKKLERQNESLEERNTDLKGRIDGLSRDVAKLTSIINDNDFEPSQLDEVSRHLDDTNPPEILDEGS